MSARAAFYRRAEEALADSALRGKIQRATDRLVAGRHASFAAFPAGDAIRDHARAIRSDVIANLDRYLTQFADQVTARGGHVHWAASATDAVSIVTGIARDRGVRCAVKSKSMVSEEIGLNAALETAGIEVVETDLGEWVVQLAHDHPSHIIAPIIHKSREDVAALFKSAAGATDQDVSDVPHMTAFARRTLRAAFLRADLGISGGNFGVAATGSLCLVTNEGNGRLTTTLPRVHVALMGIERIVPTLADLGTMLQLLARSATGQALSVYSNILTGPRRRSADDNHDRSEPDGPDELHIVLVDNGRSDLLGTELAEILYCIRCGACLNACPVYQSIGGHAYGAVYSGPVGSVLTPALHGLDAFGDLPHASSLCGACREVCPVRIDIPRMLLALRARGVREQRGPAWIARGIRLYARMATRPVIFRMAVRAARIVTRFMARDGWIRRMPGPLAGWTRQRDFPALPPATFQDAWRTRNKERG
jgi:L-lactate dehydrogenase complex protein LldF